MSRIDMNIPNTMIRNATSRRGSIRSVGAALTADDAAMSVMICHCEERKRRSNPEF
jgi:hypothetical protein